MRKHWKQKRTGWSRRTKTTSTSSKTSVTCRCMSGYNSISVRHKAINQKNLSKNNFQKPSEVATDGATDACRSWRILCSHSLSLALISIFSNGSDWESLMQSRVPRTSSSKKNEEAARRDAYVRIVKQDPQLTKADTYLFGQTSKA